MFKRDTDTRIDPYFITDQPRPLASQPLDTPPPPLTIPICSPSSGQLPQHEAHTRQSLPLENCPLPHRLPFPHCGSMPGPFRSSDGSVTSAPAIATEFHPSPPRMTSTSTVSMPNRLHTPAVPTDTSCPDIISPTPITASGSSLVVPNSLIRVKSFPHAADLLGSTSEASSSRTASRNPSPVSPHGHPMEVDPEEAQDTMTLASSRNGDQAHHSGISAPQDTLANLLRDLRERREREDRVSRLGRTQGVAAEAGSSGSQSAALLSQRLPSMNPNAYHQGQCRTPPVAIRPRVDPEPAHLAAFDRDTQANGLSELGLIRDRYHPSAYRPRAEFMTTSPEIARSSTPLSATPSTGSESSLRSAAAASWSDAMIMERRPPQSTIRSTLAPVVQSAAVSVGARPQFAPADVPRRQDASWRRMPQSRSSDDVAASSSSVDHPPDQEQHDTSARLLTEAVVGNEQDRQYIASPHRSLFAGIDSRATDTSRAPLSAGLLPIAPPIPPPRRSSASAWGHDWRRPDSFDSSPQQQTRDDREISRRRPMLEETIRDLEARGEERSIAARLPSSSVPFDRSTSVGTAFRSRYLRERLAHLDAVRTETGSMSSPNRLAADNARLLRQPNGEYSPTGIRAAHLGVPDLLSDTSMDVDEAAVDRSWAGRSRSFSRRDEESDQRAHHSDIAEIGSWNRDVQEAINRRLNLDRPRSPPSTRHYRDGALPYVRPRSVTARREFDEDIAVDTDPPRANRSPDLWGEIPVDVAGGRRHDPMDPFGRRDGSVMPPDFVEQMSRRPFRLQRSFGAPERPSTMNMLGDTRFTGRVADVPSGFGDLPPPRSERSRPPFDQDWLNRHQHDYNPSSLYNHYVAARGPPGHSAGSHYADLFSSLQLKPEMTDIERMRVVQLVAKGVTRWPSDCRRKMAENTLEHVSWGDFGEQEGMVRDEYCSVCHDEVSSCPEVTRPRLMEAVRGYVEYHRDALQAHVSQGLSGCENSFRVRGCADLRRYQTWLQTPNTSSCPMCRRDLALLACLTKMVPSKKRDEAMPLWLATS